MNPAAPQLGTRSTSTTRRVGTHGQGRVRSSPHGLRGLSTSSGSWRKRPDAGFGSVELILLVPALVLAVLLVVAVGRVEHARLQVTGAARDAARAASLTRSVPAAQTAAQTSVDVALSAESVTCTGGPSVSLDAARFEPGGVVEVTVSCTARLGDLGFPSLTASKTLTATAASPLEQYRSQP